MQQAAWLGGCGLVQGKGKKGMKGSSGCTTEETESMHASTSWKGEGNGKGVKGQSSSMLNGQAPMRASGNAE
eukprot:15439395-Alexandrium_andersonii.AAC.1